MEKKTLEIALDNGVLYTRYCTLNNEIPTKFFEGTALDGKKITPLTQAKKWAKEKGYTHLEVIALTCRGSNKVHSLIKDVVIKRKKELQPDRKSVV